MHGFGGCCGWGSFGAFGSFGWILNLVITIGLIVGVIILIVWMVRRLSSGSQGSGSYSLSQGNTAREILQNRYARGEISRDEYQQMLSDLGS